MNMKKNANFSQDKLHWSPSLRRTLKDSLEWMATTGKVHFDESINRIDSELSKQTKLSLTINIRVGMLGHACGIRACALGLEANSPELPQMISWMTDFQGLEVRILAYAGLTWESQPISPFSGSMKVANVVMLSRWREAEGYARLLISAAHRDQFETPAIWRKDSWGNGTHTTFLIYLMAEAFGIATHYEPVAPFLPAYQHLLKVWRTTDEAAFREAILPAIDFHISRSKNATERHDYEFDNYFDRVYPAELLAVQALRRRDGLPEFQTGHLLVDTPWSIIRDAEPVEPHPIFVAVQDRMRQDYPGFV